MVIYVDVLFVTNFFITFLLLQITSRLSKLNRSIFRLVLSSAIGGIYSLIILLDELSPIIVFLSKILSAFIIVFVAFKFYRVKTFLRTYFIFIFSSLIMLGVVIGACFLFHIQYVAINNSTVYFDISAKAIILSGIFAYIISVVVVRFHNRILSSNELYTLVIENNGSSATMLAFLDNGNHLREPFSNMPVIVVNSKRIENIIDSKSLRYIPSSSVNGDKLLSAFKPDRIIVKTPKGIEVIQNAYVALSDDMLNDSFSAILSPEILSV